MLQRYIHKEASHDGDDHWLAMIARHETCANANSGGDGGTAAAPAIISESLDSRGRCLNYTLPGLLAKTIVPVEVNSTPLSTVANYAVLLRVGCVLAGMAKSRVR